MLARLCLMTLLVLCLSARAWALSPIEVDSPDFRQNLGPAVQYLEDPQGSLTVDDVLGLPDRHFHQVQGTHLNRGKNDSTWWLRLSLDNQLAQSLQGFLEIDYGLLDHIELFVRTPDGRLSRQLSGDEMPFSQRPVKVSSFWFPTELPPGTSTLVLRIKTSSTLYVPLYFSSTSASAHAQEYTAGVSGAFYGVLFAMFCYNLFLYLSLRESAYLWYLAYNLNVGLLAACFDGMLFKLLPEHVAFQSVSIYILMYVHCLTAIQFIRHFLHARQYFPTLDTGLRLLMLVCIGCLLSVPLIGFAAWNILASVTVSVVSLILLLTGIYIWRRGVRYGSYYT
ncbi:MAG: hybrid sensor histidine kinase/response regulator, partial [Betaproteobacteria bacterium]|nr:hybrid sensor histidine kinase/response regulator [Betaproteobacteria bacterium]